MNNFDFVKSKIREFFQEEKYKIVLEEEYDYTLNELTKRLAICVPGEISFEKAYSNLAKMDGDWWNEVSCDYDFIIYLNFL